MDITGERKLLLGMFRSSDPELHIPALGEDVVNVLFLITYFVVVQSTESTLYIVNVKHA